ncbi:MAG: hypothetical protein PHT19_09465 [Methylococcus sp.]|nr:hypothetical protein [Methylococcus sp.]
MILLAALLVACASKEQGDLREALVAKLQDDSDLKDYKLDAATIADCVVADVTNDLPGFPGDPRRKEYLTAYARFYAAKGPGDFEKVAEEYKDLFGSVKKANEAALRMTDYIMTCMGQAIERRDPEQK